MDYSNMTSLGIFKTKVFKFIPIFNRHHKELQTMKNVDKVVCKGISVHTLPEIKQKILELIESFLPSTLTAHKSFNNSSYLVYHSSYKRI